MKRVIFFALVGFVCVYASAAEPKVDVDTWEREARGARQSGEGIAYEQAMAEVYTQAALACYGRAGTSRGFLWLGRIDQAGRLVQSHVQPRSKFARCVDRKLKRTAVDVPPVTTATAGYPLTFTWTPQ